MKSKKTLKIASITAIAAACVLSGALAINTNTASAASEDIFHELGASVRVSADKGIRFSFGLPEEKTGEGYEIGTLIIPKEVLGDKVLNHNEDTEDAETVDYASIDCSKEWLPNEKLAQAKDGYKYYNAALIEIPELRYNTVLLARSYFVKDGEYTYSDVVERSIGYVASAALNAGYDDTNAILTGIVKAGFGETEMSVTADTLVEDGATITATATNDLGYLPVWSSSDETVATVDKTGKVTALKGGEATITATIGDKSATKTVYVAGESLFVDQIGGLINGNNFGADTNYFNKTAGENGDFTVNAKLISNPSYHSALILRKMYSKEYYEKLAANGYKMTFTLGVSEATATTFSDLYVFGKKLTNFPKNADGEFAVVVDTKYIAENYDAISTITNAQAGASKRDKMFIAWAGLTNDYNTTRNYVFTFSNVKFISGALFADNIGMRVNGWDMTTNTTYMSMDVGANGEMVITANWQAYKNYGPALVLKNVESKEYYQNLINSGYKYLTFNLKVEGQDADKLTDVHVLGSAQKIADCTKEGDVYKIQIQLAHIVQFYDTITTLATSGSQAGQWGSRSAFLLAWRFSTDFATVPAQANRNYIFTISNSEYVK